MTDNIVQAPSCILMTEAVVGVSRIAKAPFCWDSLSSAKVKATGKGLSCPSILVIHGIVRLQSAVARVSNRYHMLRAQVLPVARGVTHAMIGVGGGSGRAKIGTAIRVLHRGLCIYHPSSAIFRSLLICQRLVFIGIHITLPPVRACTGQFLGNG